MIDPQRTPAISLPIVRTSHDHKSQCICLQDEKQALHERVRAALVETQNAAVADRAAEANGQDADVDAAVNAQIQQRQNQQVQPDTPRLFFLLSCHWSALHFSSVDGSKYWQIEVSRSCLLLHGGRTPDTQCCLDVTIAFLSR